MLEMLDVTIRIGMQCTDLFIFRFVSLLCLRCYIYIYIYIYVCVCVCVCVYKGRCTANTDSIV